MNGEQPMIEYGFVDISGKQWKNAYVDAYNQHTNQINKMIRFGYDKCAMATESRQAYEKALDARHAYYTEVMLYC